jgi:hypothetical protein
MLNIDTGLQSAYAMRIVRQGQGNRRAGSPKSLVGSVQATGKALPALITGGFVSLIRVRDVLSTPSNGCRVERRGVRCVFGSRRYAME